MNKIAFWASAALAGFGLSAAEVKLADFTGPHSWSAPHHVADAASSAKGFSFRVTGEDPWLVSPGLNLPAVPAGAREVKFTITCAPIKSADAWQFFFNCRGRGFNETDSCFLRPEGKAPYTRFSAHIAVPAHFGGQSSLRLDPPGGTNAYTVTGVSLEYLKPLWTYHPAPPPALAVPPETPLVLKTDTWEVRHDPARLGAFRYTSRGKAVENVPCEPFVYRDKAGQVQTLDWTQARMQTKVKPRQSFETTASLTDADGRVWALSRTFTAAQGKLRVKTAIKVDGDGPAQVLHVPALTLLVDRASNGRKHQALLPGVEYLADEPSSSDKEIRTPEHNRLIPSEPCLSAPFAVFTDEQNWLAARWGQTDLVAPDHNKGLAHPFAVVFDTPDRLLKSGGHLLAFWAPAVGEARHPSALDIYEPAPFARAALTVEFSTGAGNDIATALANLVPDNAPDKLPPPDAVDTEAACRLLAHGWLDSEIRKGKLFRHAINGGSFPFNPAADAAFLMRYLATQIKDAALAKRLRTTADEALSAVAKKDIAHSGVSHIRRPAPVLVAGDLALHLDQQAAGLQHLAAALADGKRLWQPPAGRANLGETLGDTHCNGYTAMDLDNLLAAATWSGDEAAIDRVLAIVDKVTQLYHGTVPRGAQPWEMPLHTPDIMASAHLVRIYTLAYLLRPDPAYLAEARHWAYTGLAFVYLTPPLYPTNAAKNPVGGYATCAVMGATHWVAPNWIGRPVQWCGLVYAAALYDFARVDVRHGEFWRKIAVGITLSGVRQTYTAKDDPRYVGLLPDSWNLTAQGRYWCPINPGTVEEELSEAVGRPFYSLRALASGDATQPPSLLHLAGAAEALPPKKGERRCKISCWPETPSQAVVTRLGKPSAVTLNGKRVPFTYLPAHRTAVLTLPARAKGELRVTESR